MTGDCERSFDSRVDEASRKDSISDWNSCDALFPLECAMMCLSGSNLLGVLLLLLSERGGSQADPAEGFPLMRCDEERTERGGGDCHSSLANVIERNTWYGYVLVHAGNFRAVWLRPSNSN